MRALSLPGGTKKSGKKLPAQLQNALAYAILHIFDVLYLSHVGRNSHVIHHILHYDIRIDIDIHRLFFAPCDCLMGQRVMVSAAHRCKLKGACPCRRGRAQRLRPKPKLQRQLLQHPLRTFLPAGKVQTALIFYSQSAMRFQQIASTPTIATPAKHGKAAVILPVCPLRAAQTFERKARDAAPAFPPADKRRQETAAGFARQEAAALL
jgi:hypothetical protein